MFEVRDFTLAAAKPAIVAKWKISSSFEALSHRNVLQALCESCESLPFPSDPTASWKFDERPCPPYRVRRPLNPLQGERRRRARGPVPSMHAIVRLTKSQRGDVLAQALHVLRRGTVHLSTSLGALAALVPTGHGYISVTLGRPTASPEELRHAGRASCFVQIPPLRFCFCFFR